MMTRLRERLEMVERQIARAGISDERVLEAMRAVPREEFYPPGFEDAAYRGGELPGWAAEALTEPLALATLLEGLSVGPRDRVLEVGTGTGYGAAVLARMATEVVSMEISGALCALARTRLRAIRADNVRVVEGDGTQGWPERAPYDAILVTASGHFVPPPLLAQLALGGRLVMPVGPPDRSQRLLRLTRRRRAGEDQYVPETLGRGARFVPLRGRAGG
jgi:protein-L-isoaspartate(D-aspartate) O-methyltransferase